MDSYKLSNASKRNRAGVDPRLIEISDRAIQITLIDFGHPEYAGLRTLMQQKELYEKGLSMCDGKEKRSKHQDGRALDFYAFKDGVASWKAEDLTLVATAFLQAAMEMGHRIRWGGLWKGFRDMPHIELLEDET